MKRYEDKLDFLEEVTLLAEQNKDYTLVTQIRSTIHMINDLKKEDAFSYKIYGNIIESNLCAFQNYKKLKEVS
ncbi:hypothetical protein [Bacillus badius]|uniref:hypothetical protein n=1 Tax=Bacillus badius TaxID=1455 RepID=UPI0007B38B86|nr:hypothetical protein [Bacillus badius]KZR56948.1 hypothetical protein A3781_20420 [Bacillus badius]